MATFHSHRHRAAGVAAAHIVGDAERSVERVIAALERDGLRQDIGLGNRYHSAVVRGAALVKCTVSPAMKSVATTAGGQLPVLGLGIALVLHSEL